MMSRLFFPLIAVGVIISLVIMTAEMFGKIDHPEPEQESMYVEIYESSVLCEWVKARPLGMYQSYCEVCVDNGMVIDECALPYGDRVDLYKERVVPVIDSLMAEYERKQRWR